MHLNVNSLQNKIEEGGSLIREFKAQVMFLTETKILTKTASSISVGITYTGMTALNEMVEVWHTSSRPYRQKSWNHQSLTALLNHGLSHWRTSFKSASWGGLFQPPKCSCDIQQLDGWEKLWGPDCSRETQPGQGSRLWLNTPQIAKTSCGWARSILNQNIQLMYKPKVLASKLKERWMVTYLQEGRKAR